MHTRYAALSKMCEPSSMQRCSTTKSARAEELHMSKQFKIPADAISKFLAGIHHTYQKGLALRTSIQPRCNPLQRTLSLLENREGAPHLHPRPTESRSRETLLWPLKAGGKTRKEDGPTRWWMNGIDGGDATRS